MTCTFDFLSAQLSLFERRNQINVFPTEITKWQIKLSPIILFVPHTRYDICSCNTRICDIIWLCWSNTTWASVFPIFLFGELFMLIFMKFTKTILPFPCDWAYCGPPYCANKIKHRSAIAIKLQKGFSIQFNSIQTKQRSHSFLICRPLKTSNKKWNRVHKSRVGVSFSIWEKGWNLVNICILLAKKGATVWKEEKKREKTHNIIWPYVDAIILLINVIKKTRARAHTHTNGKYWSK